MNRLTDSDIYESFAILSLPVRMAVTMDAKHRVMEEVRYLQAFGRILLALEYIG